MKQTDKKQKRNNEIDQFITEAALNERVTLKTNSIKIIEYIIGKINETSGLFYFGENSYQLYGLIEQRKKGSCTYIESSLNKHLYPSSLNNNMRSNTKRLHMHIKRIKGGLFFCDEINDKIDIQVESEKVEDFNIKRGDLVSKKEFEEKMFSLGYENVDTTKHKGEICARGGIIDVYPINEYYPIRLEFFGNKVDTIRSFDINTQLSIKQKESISIENNKKDIKSVESISYEDYILDNNYKVLYGKVSENIYEISNKRSGGGGEIYNINTSSVRVSLKKIEQKNSSIINIETLYKESKRKENGYSKKNINKYKFEKINNDLFIKYKENNNPYRFIKKKDQNSDKLYTYEWGDYITHEDFGVGIYRGVTTRNNSDYIKIEYKNKSSVFISTLKMNKICPFIGAPGPNLNSINDKKWISDKRLVREKINTIIKEMIDINKNRELERKYYIKNDDLIDRGVEESFPYIETKDQRKAIKDVYKDMSTPGLMDRIIIGDVGFGKTEIAIRAAVKAVIAGGFVLVVVPTTILADQHYISFKGRLENLGINVEMISRFVSKKNRDLISLKILDKQVDILIGTHAILNDNIPKNNLSLIIVDEEHKFGVSHKNKLLKIKHSLDVLTLSATPIPRTLQQSIIGVRDVSIIQTPPNNRLPIQSRVLYKNWDHLYKLINKELVRGGQVYFLHNRVETLPVVFKRIQSMFPGLNIAMAHGQMSSRKLEEVVLSFFAGEVTVLVCTSIIESGLDVSNANSIIINDAHMFGLSQLYQIRGRVGRGVRQAFCYLLIPPIERLTNDAVERLKALEASTELGSGYNIALKDLEIRGAGNLFGYEQSGSVDKVGYHLYCKMFEQALQKDKGNPESKRAVNINADFNSFFDKAYMSLSEDRIYYYQRLALASSLAEVVVVEGEIVDRFGPLSRPATNILSLTKLKCLYSNSFVTSIELNDKFLLFTITNRYADNFNSYFDSLVERLDSSSLTHTFKQKNEKDLYINIPINNCSDPVQLAFDSADCFTNN